MKLENKYSVVYHFALAVCAFVMVALPKLVPVSIAVLVLVSIYLGIKKQLKRNDSIKIHIAFISFYVAYVIGLLFSYYPEVGLKYLEYKLAFLIFPAVFLYRPKFNLKFEFPLVGLLIAIIIVSTIDIVQAWNCYVKIDYFFNCFASSYFVDEHPTYYTVFLTFSIIGVWQAYFKKISYFKLFPVLAYSFFALILIGLCLSMAGILFIILLSSIIVLYFLVKFFGKLKAFLISLLLFSCVIFTVYSIPVMRDELNNTLKSYNAYIENPEKFISSEDRHFGDDVRLIMWTASTQEFLNHPFGVGTGNVDVYLSKRLNHYGQHEIAKLDERHQIIYNPHNQFLQTGLEIGLLGLFLLIYIVYYSFREGFKTKNWLLVILAFNFTFNSIFESMLQRQSGIIFYTFWIVLLFLIDTPVKSEVEVEKQIEQ